MTEVTYNQINDLTVQLNKFSILPYTETVNKNNKNLSIMTNLHNVFTGQQNAYPQCEKKRFPCQDLTCYTCFLKSFASHPKSDCWSALNTVNPRFICKGSDTKCLFVCNVCCHLIEPALYSVKSGRWCAYCEHKKLCDDDSCIFCYNNSFASHEKASMWSIQNMCRSRDVLKTSNKEYLFMCKCGHLCKSKISEFIRTNSCAFCGGYSFCNDMNCIICFQKSFASHGNAKYWSPQNQIHPRFVFMYTHVAYKFDCYCGYTFDSDPHHILEGKWCPFCSSKLLCNDMNCVQCYEKSFASHERAKYWDQSNGIHPRFVFKSSGIKYSFNCEDCNNKYESILANVIKGNWCRCRSNKTQAKLYNFLQSSYSNIDIVAERRFEWCKNIRCLPFDFCIEAFKLIIELDGPQHFKQIWNWVSPEENQQNDILKMDLAYKNGYSIIRIIQGDVFYDRTDWTNELLSKIKLYKSPCRIFIGKEYECVPKYHILPDIDFS